MSCLFIQFCKHLLQKILHSNASKSLRKCYSREILFLYVIIMCTWHLSFSELIWGTFEALIPKFNFEKRK